MKKIEFTSKYDLGQQVFYLDSYTKKIKASTITKVNFYLTPDGTELWYKLEDGAYERDYNLYGSREELISNL